MFTGLGKGKGESSRFLGKESSRCLDGEEESSRCLEESSRCCLGREQSSRCLDGEGAVQQVLKEGV